MPAKYSIFLLSEDERQHLDDLTCIGMRHARTIQHAHIFLLVDETDGAGPAWTDEKVADALACGTATVTHPAALRQRGLP